MDKARLFMDGTVPLCPLCGRELEKGAMSGEGWQCRCGEFIPEGLVINPVEGCTHGLNCNCGRRARPGGHGPLRNR